MLKNAVIVGALGVGAGLVGFGIYKYVNMYHPVAIKFFPPNTKGATNILMNWQTESSCKIIGGEFDPSLGNGWGTCKASVKPSRWGGATVKKAKSNDGYGYFAWMGYDDCKALGGGMNETSPTTNPVRCHLSYAKDSFINSTLSSVIPSKRLYKILADKNKSCCPNATKNIVDLGTDAKDRLDGSDCTTLGVQPGSDASCQFNLCSM
jgi:hypothetical protein